MPQNPRESASESGSCNAESALGVVMFENWLRFYFMRASPGNGSVSGMGLSEDSLYMDIPDADLATIKNLYPQYWQLASILNKKEVDFVKSRDAICACLLNSSPTRDTARDILNSKNFQAVLLLFNAWLQLHADQLARGALPFAIWQNLFAQWRSSAGGRELFAKLLHDAPEPGGQSISS